MTTNNGASAIADRATQASPQALTGLGQSVSIPSADFTAEDFLAWVETRPAGQHYDYGDVKGCAICQYLIDRGIGFKTVSSRHYTGADGEFRRIPKPIGDIGYVSAVPHTYGALARRLKRSAAR